MSKSPSKHLHTLQSFTAAVNSLDVAKCERINKEPGILFKAVHTPFREGMMKSYFDAGLSPSDALNEIDDNAEAEGRAEAACS